MKRAPRVLARYVDDYGEERTVHRRPNGRLAVARERETPSLRLSSVIGTVVGERVRDLRRARKMSMATLAQRAGLAGGKQRIREIEIGAFGGVKLGTVYALAFALQVQPDALLPTLEDALPRAGVGRTRPASLAVTIADECVA